MQYYHHFNPDLVILDLHMPDVSGDELLQQLTAASTGIYLPVLILTADLTSRVMSAPG